jgi:hypothetical protein
LTGPSTRKNAAERENAMSGNDPGCVKTRRRIPKPLLISSD